jgi:integrase/recombinase XerC
MYMVNEFLSYLSNEKRFSKHTTVAYKKDVEQFFELIVINDVKLINHKDIRAYIVIMVEAGNENSTVNRKLSTLKTYFKFLKRQNCIDINPMLKIQGLKTKKRLPQFVPENQIWDKSLFCKNEDQFSNLRDELILELFYQTGIRLDELINLKLSNVNDKSIKVIGKRNKERIIPITTELDKLIIHFQMERAKVLSDSEFLIITKVGKKLSPKFVYSKVNYYLSIATNLKKKSPHVLRHTFATHMLNNGASLESIKKILGHTDLVATQVYTHNTFKQVNNIYKSSHPRGRE